MRLRNQTIWFGQRTFVLGVLNVTPDSFSGDGLAGNLPAVVERARQMLADGADWLDVGGESTRPGATPVSRGEETDRVCPAIVALRAELGEVPISIDTRWAEVAEAALYAGADLVNDVSGLANDPPLADVVYRFGVPVVLQHSRGTPATMQAAAHYEDVVDEVVAELAQRLQVAAAARIRRDCCLVDPGLGFAKLARHNLQLLRRLGELRVLGAPILVGPSRKRFVGEVLGTAPDDRLEGTAAAVALAIAGGADVVRVHDVREMARVARMSDAIVRGTLPPPPRQATR